MKTPEEQVREFWSDVTDDKYEVAIIRRIECEKERFFGQRSRYKRALAFTNQRKQEIVECQNALNWIRLSPIKMKTAAEEYIEAMLQARLAELKRGTVMEEPADGQ